MRRFWYVVLAVLVTCPMLAATAEAWEMGMKGRFVYEVEYVSQDKAGFFGPHNADSTAGGGHEQINFWPGLQGPEDYNTTVSGCDAGWHVQWGELHPSITFNKAIKWEALVYLGQWDFANDAGDRATVNAPGLLARSEYTNSRFRGIWRSMTPFYVNYWRVKVKLPWGDLSMGKRPSSWGIGLMQSGKHGFLKTSNSTSNSVSFTAPFGPLSIGFSFYPNREGNEGYYNRTDRTNIRWANFAYGATYKCGPLETGFAIGHAYRHRGGERTIGNAGNTRDRADLDAGAYFKYFNGRFFLNGEFRWYDRYDVFCEQNAIANNDRLYYDQELRAWAVEGGALVGPTKAAVLVADVSGPDRRAYNVVGDSAVFKQNTLASISANFSNTTLFFPYSYLMVYSYGTGLAGNGHDGNGYFDAGRFYGARVDYAVAANLNLVFTYCQAFRKYKGFGWGYIRPDANGEIQYGALNNGAVRSPAIPDDNLGWEVSTGFWWKLLEGLTMYGRVAYWQPGEWFNYACVSKANPNWLTPATDTVYWGTNPDRSVDPIIGGFILTSFDF